MDFQNEYEQELVFQIEPKKGEEKQSHKQKKVVKLALENLRKMAMYKLEGKSGEC